MICYDTAMTETCAIPLSDELGKPLFDTAGNRVQCGKPVPSARLPNRLCDEHYEPVSDAAIGRYIASRLAKAAAPSGQEMQ
jgi:hypothetical protein